FKLRISTKLWNAISLRGTTIPPRPRMDNNSVLPYLIDMTLTRRVPGVIRPYYVHTPTSCVYECPVVTGIPLGVYSMSNGMLTLNSNYFRNSGGFGVGYI